LSVKLNNAVLLAANNQSLQEKLDEFACQRWRDFNGTVLTNIISQETSDIVEAHRFLEHPTIELSLIERKLVFIHAIDNELVNISKPIFFTQTQQFTTL
jgi:hypothetical protein